MRQTTVLIAQLSTAAGIRAPLAHLADQVFVNLATEIESQGVGRKVVADMFGLALRTYQKKLQRLSESVTSPDRTLWQATLDFIQENGSVTRKRVFERFQYDGERHVAAVLNDLTTSGLVYATGRGDATVYGITSEADQERISRQQDLDSVTGMAWVTLYRRPQTLVDLKAGLPIDAKVIEQAVDTLIKEGRVRVDDASHPPLLRADSFVVPIGVEQGWEASVFDHFRSVANAIASKVQRGTLVSSKEDVIGGATLSFDIYPGHPDESEVYGLLAHIREEVNKLWNRVSNHNREHPVRDRAKTKVVFYFGQNVEPCDDECLED